MELEMILHITMRQYRNGFINKQELPLIINNILNTIAYDREVGKLMGKSGAPATGGAAAEEKENDCV